MISLIPFSKGYLDYGENDIRNNSYKEMLANFFANQTFYGSKTDINLTFYFPNLYKNHTWYEFYTSINISLYCFTNDLEFSKEINASYYQLSKFEDIDEYFYTQPRDFQNCFIEQTHKNFKVGFLNFAISFKSQEYPYTEVFRAMYSEMIYTNTEGCLQENELISSKFMVCDYNCLKNQLKPFPNPSSTLKFCVTESCIETVEKLDLLEDQDVYLLQELASDLSKDFQYEDSLIFYYSEDGFVRHIYPQSPSIYSQGKITYHIKINNAWIDFQFSAILKLYNTEKIQSHYIGGNTDVIECVKDQELNCIECESMCRMNCGEAPSYCVCENSTCFAQNLYSLISILIFLVMV